MIKLRPTVAALALALCAASLFTPASAQPTTEDDAAAEALNTQGKVEMARAQKFAADGHTAEANEARAAAKAKFEAATQRSNQPKYWSNYCFMLYQMGQYGEAYNVCQRGKTLTTDPVYLARLDGLIVEIQKQAQLQGLVLAPATQPAQATTETAPPPVQGVPPAPAVTGAPPATATPSDFRYIWGWGIDLQGMALEIGPYSKGAALRGHVDYLLSTSSLLGVSGYADLAQLSSDTGESDPFIMAGGALYKHILLRSLNVTPAVGIHAVTLGSNGEYTGLGVRAEVAAGWIFGSQKEHELSLRLGLTHNFDMQASDNTTPVAAHSIMMLGLGYTLRYTSILQQPSFFTFD